MACLLVIDRFEGEFAVVEYNGQTFNLPKKLLPSEAKEGDILNIVVKVDRKATDERQKKIRALSNNLFEH